MPSQNLEHAIGTMRGIASNRANAIGVKIAGTRDVMYYAEALVKMLENSINSNIKYEAVRSRLINGISVTRISPMFAHIDISAPVISDIINGKGEEANLASLHRKGFVVSKHAFFRGKDGKPHPLFGTGIPASKYLEEAASMFNTVFAGQAICNIVS